MSPAPAREDLGLLRRRLAAFLGEHRPRRSGRGGDTSTPPLWDEIGIGPQAARSGSHVAYAYGLIQTAVLEVLEMIEQRGWEAYLVGGTLRDLMLGPAKAGALGVFPRDIDIIVVNTDLDELGWYFDQITTRRTRFGGLHVVKPIARSCEVHFDIWPLRNTWALEAYSFPPTIGSFPLTPFLNLDAIAAEIFPSARQPRRIYECGFFNGLKEEIIDINFKPNPFPDVCAARALIMAAKLQFSMTRNLADFVWQRCHGAGIQAVMEAQLSHYGQVRSPVEELRSWVRIVEEQLASDSERIAITVPRSRQLELWTDHPKLLETSDSSGFTPDREHADTRP